MADNERLCVTRRDLAADIDGYRSGPVLSIREYTLFESLDKWLDPKSRVIRHPKTDPRTWTLSVHKSSDGGFVCGSRSPVKIYLSATDRETKFFGYISGNSGIAKPCRRLPFGVTTRATERTISSESSLVGGFSPITSTTTSTSSFNHSTTRKVESCSRLSTSPSDGSCSETERVIVMLMCDKGGMAILFLDLQKILQVADSGQALPLEDISYKLYIKSEDGGKPVAFDNWLWIKANKAQLQRQSLFMFDQNQNDIRELLLTAATRDRWPGYNNVKISVKR